MTENKPILIITYYWPPSGGSGVQRWLKFVKFFPQYGITPIVFTPADPHFEIKDPSLLADIPSETEILHFPIWEPYQLVDRVKRFFGDRKKGKTQSIAQPEGFLGFIRANFFIPDPRVFWVKPSVHFLKDFIQEHKIEKIVTTGPPHSVHLIGLRLKKEVPNLKWLADFRDPWTTWGFLLGMRPTKLALAIHKKLEQRVLHSADAVTTVSPFYGRQLGGLASRRVDVFTNGFDVSDFKDLRHSWTPSFVIRHVGILHPACDYVPFLKVLSRWILKNSLQESVEVRFTGHVHDRFATFVQEDAVLKRVVKVESAVDHSELIRLYGQTSAVVLLLTGYKDAEGFLPGKLFEYLATGLPLIAVGPSQGDAAQVLKETQAGMMADSNDEQAIEQNIENAYSLWKQKKAFIPMPESAMVFSRERIAARMSEYLKSL